MPSSGNTKGYAIALIFTGSIFAYAGIKGLSITSALTAIIQGKSPSTATAFGQFNVIAAATGAAAGTAGASGTGSGPAATPISGVTTGNELANGTIIYKFLRSHGYNPMQAAGAVASMWGEGSFDPESVGTGGGGIYGATPLPPGMVTGNPSKDMATQLNSLMSFVARNGDQGAVNSMANAGSISAAAQIWDHQVERAGINDVHSQGIALAAQISKAVDGVSLPQ